MTRTDVINRIAKKYGYKKYLEIGIQAGINFSSINIEDKTGVDPIPSRWTTHVLTSDSFFEFNTDTYNLIFIDGLHLSEQVYKDITNALKVLQDGGTIVCHDMLPITEESQRYPQITTTWNGDCWKAWVRLRQKRKDLFMGVVDVDWGCGIIRLGNQELLAPILPEDLTFENYIKNRQEWMNVMSLDEILVA